MSEEGFVLIKRDMFWRPNSEGYTGVRESAGIYREDDVLLAKYPRLDAYSPRHGWEDTYALPVSLAPEFTNACCVHVQRDILRQHRAELLAALQKMKTILRDLQPALNVMAREVMDDIIKDQIDPAISKATGAA